MNSYHNTLNEALTATSEKLVELWPFWEAVNYGETKQLYVIDGFHTRLISVYRRTSGAYESALTYLTD